MNFILLGDVPIQYKIRLIGIDTPEIRSGKGKLKAEKIAGKICRDFLSSIINDQIVAVVYSNPYTNISNLMVNRAYARKYDGSKKQKWTRAELINILNK